MSGDPTGPQGPNRIVRSPAISPSRPLSIRHLSADLDTYIDMYGLSQDISDDRKYDHSPAATDEFLSSSDVAQELKNLQNLRRISLDGGKLDPDVPPQNYEVTPAMKSHDANEDEGLGSSLYWVPAHIHPELAPQEWQSFVQKRDGTQEDDLFTAPMRNLSMKRGLSRSKSLLSREIPGSAAAEKYTDAGPELNRRRSRLQPELKVRDLQMSTDPDTLRGRGAELTRTTSEQSITEESSPVTASDEPLLIPPPGQILRRAARTGKAKGSYRKLGRSRTPPVETGSPSEPSQPGPLGSPQHFDSETIQLRDDAPRDKIVPSPTEAIDIEDEKIPIARKKSSNRAVQIVGPRSPPIQGENVQGGPSHTSDWPTRPPVVAPIPTPDVSEPISKPEEQIHSISNAESHARVEPVVVDPPAPSPISPVREMPHQTPIAHETTELNQRSGTPSIVSSASSTTAGVGRPNLKRELSAASLTRAVMNGTAPVQSGPVQSTTANSPPRRAPSEEATPGPASSGSLVKKSAWGKLFSSDDKEKNRSKKDGKIPPKIANYPSQERASSEKDHASSNLFTSIFGGKKREKETPTVDVVKREPPPPQRAVVREPHFYSRYPIQLERAIYRMAHLKLGNSRRPLAHQVLLSNFMYGYLALVGANSSGQSQGPSGSHKSRSSSPQRSNNNKDHQPDTSENQWKAGASPRPASHSSHHQPNRSRRENGDSNAHQSSAHTSATHRSAEVAHDHAVHKSSSSTPPTTSTAGDTITNP